MSRRDRRARHRAGEPQAGAGAPLSPASARYAHMGPARPEDAERLFAGAAMATAGATLQIIPPDGADSAADRLPSRLFVAVVPDAYAPLAPLFALRGTGPQPWPVSGQFGWSAATATDDQPPRVVLKMDITKPLSISAKVLFLPDFPGIRDSLVVAAEGGVIGLMSASQWDLVTHLLREGTDLATVFDRAVLVSIQPAVYLGPFLANLPRHDN